MSSLSTLSEDVKTLFVQINTCLDDELARINPDTLVPIIAENNNGLTLAIVLLVLSMFLFAAMPLLPYLLSLDIEIEMKKAAE